MAEEGTDTLFILNATRHFPPFSSDTHRMSAISYFAENTLIRRALYAAI